MAVIEVRYSEHLAVLGCSGTYRRVNCTCGFRSLTGTGNPIWYPSEEEAMRAFDAHIELTRLVHQLAEPLDDQGFFEAVLRAKELKAVMRGQG